MTRRRVAAVLAAVVGAGSLLGVSPSPTASADPPPPHKVLLGAEDNRLRAYDPITGESQVVVYSNADDPQNGLDINAQICEDPLHPGYFIDGEDTHQPNPLQGWGYFRLLGTGIPNLTATQVGKLTPTYQATPDNAENYGCGFLANGNLITTDVGDQQPTGVANGQLIIWFRPPGGLYSGSGTTYCKIDINIPTAGGAWVEGNTVFVAANRPDLAGLQLGGIYRYDGSWPTGPTAAQGCGRTDGTGAPLVSEGRITETRFITAEPIGALTPSAIVRAPNGNYYVSSVLTGVIAEYSQTGAFVRRVLQPALLDLQPPYATGTPYGMAVGDDGSLYYADIGVTLDALPNIGPGDHNGSQRVIRFVDGQPQAPVTLLNGLQYPDGQGFVTVTGSPGAPVTSPNSSSQWGCGDWGMYGANLGRTFSTECATSINPLTALTMIPSWIKTMPRTVTASPAVVGGTVYVGDWSGTMYALRLTDGVQRWAYHTDAAPGAAFGPIVSSAAVTDVVISGVTKRLVIFGAGPQVYALDAANGSLVWRIDRSAGLAGTPVEFESSPVVWKGIVYIGLDTHNRPATETNGVRGGLMALDAATGASVFTFEPELLQPGAGCGSVWSSPTIDTVNNRVLLATGNCEAPAPFGWNAHTEAVTALDATTGNVAWTFQPHAANRQDLDFGATPNVITLPGGQRLIGIGNKDAVYYALNPVTGALVWSHAVAIPGNLQEDFAVGGFIGSTATWRGDVYGGTALGGPPWYHSLSGATGASRWSGIAGPSYAASAVVNGVVFSGDLTGTLKAFNAANGLPVGIYPVLGPISAGPAIAGNTVVIGSGTSASDLCAKGVPGSDVCAMVLELTLGSIGSVTALKPFTLLP